MDGLTLEVVWSGTLARQAVEVAQRPAFVEVSERLTATRRVVAELLRREPDLSAGEVARRTALSERQVDTALVSLVRSGDVRAVGSRSRPRYRLVRRA